MADYILVWSGGGGDDVAKSPHLARIANSVYRDMCSDPVCSTFGFVSRILEFSNLDVCFHYASLTSF